MTTKADIIALLKTNDKAVARALVALTARQTSTEQSAEQTINRNGEGFRPCHARMGTSMAKFFERRGYLTTKQIEYWRKPMKGGKMRIEIYAAQLLEIAKAKLAQRAQVPAPQGDIGNLLEERMVLQEILSHKEVEYGEYLDSDDEPKLQVMFDEIKQIKGRLAAIDNVIRACGATHKELALVA